MDQPEYHRGMLMAEGSLDYDGFTDKVNELLQLAQISEDDITFTENNPVGNDPDSITVPVITFDIHERIRSKSHKSLDPILFDKYLDPNDQTTLIRIFRMWFDVEMEFKVYHTSNRASRILMEQFETFLFTYKPYFKNQGISDIIFLAETKPTVESRFNKELSVRTLRYLVRIERITTIRSNTIQEINATASVNSDTPYVQGNSFLDAYRSSQFRTNE
jgi:hypothetical protein